MTTITLKPYLDGKGPTLTVDLANGTMTTDQGVEVFAWDPEDYSPGLHCTTDLHEVEDLLTFAQAYAERGDEFDRDPEDAEQVNKAWWVKHGDTFAITVVHGPFPELLTID
tara:strand:- start:325 stop:657 length:333 start_codon:yes stop_codon:yes gene_type:complete